MMPIETVLIGVTYACQCDCVHCGAALSHDPKRIELSTDEIKSLIDQCQDIHATKAPMLKRPETLNDHDQ